MEENQARSLDPLKVFWSRKWELLIFTMVCTVTSYFITSFIPEVYESESSVLIDTPKGDESLNKLLKAQHIIQGKRPYKEIHSLSIKSYRDLAYTSGYLQSVIEQLKFKYPEIANDLYPQDLKNMIKIKIPIVSSNAAEIPSTLMSFTVKGHNPEMITEIANITTVRLAEESSKIRSNEISKIIKSNRAQHESIKKLLIHKENVLKNLNRGIAVKTHKLNTSISEEKTNNLNYSQSKYQNIEQVKNEILISKNSLIALSERLAEIQIAEAEKTSDVRFIYKAVKPRSPISQNKLNIVLMSFVVSLTLGGCISLAKEHLDNIS